MFQVFNKKLQFVKLISSKVLQDIISSKVLLKFTIFLKYYPEINSVQQFILVSPLFILKLFLKL